MCGSRLVRLVEGWRDLRMEVRNCHRQRRGDGEGAHGTDDELGPGSGPPPAR